MLIAICTGASFCANARTPIGDRARAVEPNKLEPSVEGEAVGYRSLGDRIRGTLLAGERLPDRKVVDGPNADHCEKFGASCLCPL
jgi:hypothetical protein